MCILSTLGYQKNDVALVFRMFKESVKFLDIRYNLLEFSINKNLSNH